MFTSLIRGALAGAAGTTALNAVTYVDMAVRARPASEMPQQAVDKVSHQAGHPVPGEGQQRTNRLQGLGSLSGIATGIAIGAAAGLVAPVLTRLPRLLGGAVLGGAAMAATDLPATRLQLTDPSTWSAADWASDAVPHLAYGIVAHSALRRLRAA